MTVKKKPTYEWIDQSEESEEEFRITFSCFPDDVSHIQDYIVGHGTVIKTEVKREVI
jgi:hypothetical protein